MKSSCRIDFFQIWFRCRTREHIRTAIKRYNTRTQQQFKIVCLLSWDWLYTCTIALLLGLCIYRSVTLRWPFCQYIYKMPYGYLNVRYPRYMYNTIPKMQRTLYKLIYVYNVKTVRIEYSLKKNYIKRHTHKQQKKKIASILMDLFRAFM